MAPNKQSTIGVIVITHNAKHHLPHCLPPLLESPLQPRVLVVNSSSFDGTVEEAEALGAETMVIPRREFNHGSTREKARKALKTDIVVMMTPDAYATSKDAIERLISPIVSGKARVAYGRQIPHDGAGFFASFPRGFNYPPQSHFRTISDVRHYGIYTFFCSNAFAAYSQEALEEIGGFQRVLFGEDTVAVANILRKGHAIGYVADAVVKHSHSYSLLQEFKRHFDIGLGRESYRRLLSIAGSDAKRGRRYVVQMIKQLAKEKPYLLPYAIVQSFAKWLGYTIGRHSQNAPLTFKKLLSQQDFYWVYKDDEHVDCADARN
ncbi:MAG: glycosyltransferase [Waddliaceae bacterium]